MNVRSRSKLGVSLIVLAIAALFMGLGGCTGPQGPAGPPGPPGGAVQPGVALQPEAAIVTGSAVDAVAKVTPTLVRIDVTGANFAGSGSGTIIDTRGYVLTNYHVIEKARTIKVTVANSGVYDGSVIASDSTRDLALVQILAVKSGLVAVTLGEASDMVVGVDVVAGGFPLGTDLSGPPTFTRGIISAIRMFPDKQNYIQTDAAINPGNSGGCLFTLDAKMIGVPSAGIDPPGEDVEGIELAIPIDDTLTFIHDNLP